MSLSATQVQAIKDRITITLTTHSNIAPAQAKGLLPIKALQGKLYEAHVLADVIESLATQESCKVLFKGSGKLMLKQKGGPINHKYPYFEVMDFTNTLVGELYTDIEFTSISHARLGSGIPKSGDYHELDIVLLAPGCTGRPPFDKVRIGVECKNTSITKSMIRSLLGYKRELSYLSSSPNATNFTNWPTPIAYSNPPSIYILYCSDSKSNKYLDNCSVFDIHIKHFRM